MESFPRVLFDEAHGESWTIRRDVAEAMNPGHPDDSSYARAAEQLRHLGHTVSAHTEGALDTGTLHDQDVLVIAHPAEQRWERTTGGSPVFTDAELDAITAYVAEGGGLVVLAEEEQDKYGSNLADLLSHFGVGVEHTTARDPKRAHRDVATWVLADRPARTGLLAGVKQAAFYRAGVLAAGDDAQVLFATSPTAAPAAAPLALTLEYGKGRVAVFADSDLFGDDSIEDYDHRRLWGNIVTWAARVPGDARQGRCATRPRSPGSTSSRPWSSGCARSRSRTARCRRTRKRPRTSSPPSSPRWATWPGSSRTTPPTSSPSRPTWPSGSSRTSGHPTSSTRSTSSTPTPSASTGWSTSWCSPCTPRTATSTATSRPSGSARSGRTGSPPWRPGATTTRCSSRSPSRTSPPGTTPIRPCCSPRPSPCARRPSASPGAASSPTARPRASAPSRPPPPARSSSTCRRTPPGCWSRSSSPRTPSSCGT